MPWRRALLGVAVLSGGLGATYGWAQTGGADAGPAETGAAASAEPASPEGAATSAKTGVERRGPSEPTGEDTAQRLRERAAAIRALVAGTLDPSVDPSTLFTFDLTDAAFTGERGEALTGLLDAIRMGPRRGRLAFRPRRPAKGVAPMDPASAAAEDLLGALREFLWLSPAKRSELFEAQRLRRERSILETTRRGERIEALEKRTQALRALLAGNLDIEVDPGPLLRIDLSEPGGVTTPGGRLERALAAPAEPAAGETREALDRRLVEAETNLDRTLIEIARLPPAGRQALLDRHAERRREARRQVSARAEAGAEMERRAAEIVGKAERAAEDAARARQEALETARRSRSEAKRIVAEEKARLLGVKEAHARLRATLAAEDEKISHRREESLGLQRDVDRLIEREEGGGVVDRAADELYGRLVAALEEARADLAKALGRVSADSEVTPVGEGLDASLPAEVSRREIAELRRELASSERELEKIEADERWRVASSLRDQVVAMNQSRLELFQLLSPERRSALTGFGVEGVRQVGSEVEQMKLQVHYRLLSIPRVLVDGLDVPLFSIAIVVAEVVAILFAFFWWRRRSRDVLDGLRRRWRKSSRPGRLRRTVDVSLWYLERIEGPFALLAAAWLLLGAMSNAFRLPEVDLLWVVALWALVGAVVVHFLDAVAARQALASRSADRTATLRVRSLRVVGLAVVGIGLALSLTEESVGRGAIRAWVVAGAWVLALLLAVDLVRRWRPVVVGRIRERPRQNRFTELVGSEAGGVRGFAAGAVGAVYLLGAGIVRWSFRQLSTLEASRHALAWVFRRQVTRAAKQRAERAPLEPLSADVRARLEGARSLLESVAETGLGDVVRLARVPGTTISAVVGELGSGKTVFLDRVASRFEGDTVIRVDCPPGGIEALLGAFRENLRLPATAKAPEVSRALAARAPAVVCIDDLQRIVRPAVGGLADLDRTVEMALASGCNWVVAVAAPVWQHVTRARGHRALLDRVVELAPWDEREIGDLVRARTEEAGIVPDFGDLVVPQQLDEEEGLDDAVRAERSYRRILWDYAEGNPGVALHFLGESLFRDGDGAVKVRLFDTPPLSELESLPHTTYFVLRAIVQLDLAAESDVVSCTMLHPAEVTDTLRFARARGWIEYVGDRHRIALPWYRAITTALRRQNLLSQ